MTNHNIILPCSSLEWMNPSLHLERLDRLAELIKKKGYESFELTYQVQIHSSLEVRMQQFESFNQSDTASLDVVIYDGHQVGTASCSGLIWNDWVKTVEQAIIFAQLAQPDQYAQLPPLECFKQPIGECGLFMPATLTGDQFLTQALALEQAALDHKKIVNSDGASVSASYEIYCVVNSQGLRAVIPSSIFSQSIYVMAAERDQKENDGAYEYRRNWNDFSSALELGQLAAQRALAKLNARSIVSGDYPIVFSPRCSGSIIKNLFAALSGRSQYLKTSFLEGMLGQQVLPSWISINDNPRLLGGLQSFPIDADGLPTYAHQFIEHGVVLEYILSYYSAQRLGLKTNALASGLLNTTMTTNVSKLHDIVKKYPKCLVIDQLTGTGVNILTGDYSRGVDGFYYEHGERIHALQDVTIASNLKEMLNSIEYHASDYDPYRGLKVGSLAIPSMSVSGHGDESDCL
ncbi:hypothetical protein EBR43_01755 [bacterium]|nr:hypothetical protein [bacterium]NBW56512.1 hypothetical protein [bacterium]NBX72591.1 hypothetical protein [bacterium]